MLKRQSSKFSKINCLYIQNKRQKGQGEDTFFPFMLW